MALARGALGLRPSIIEASSLRPFKEGAKTLLLERQCLLILGNLEAGECLPQARYEPLHKGGSVSQSSDDPRLAAPEHNKSSSTTFQEPQKHSKMKGYSTGWPNLGNLKLRARVFGRLSSLAPALQVLLKQEENV